MEGGTWVIELDWKVNAMYSGLKVFFNFLSEYSVLGFHNICLPCAFPVPWERSLSSSVPRYLFSVLSFLYCWLKCGGNVEHVGFQHPVKSIPLVPPTYCIPFSALLSVAQFLAPWLGPGGIKITPFQAPFPSSFLFCLQWAVVSCPTVDKSTCALSLPACSAVEIKQI